MPTIFSPEQLEAFAKIGQLQQVGGDMGGLGELASTAEQAAVRPRLQPATATGAPLTPSLQAPMPQPPVVGFAGAPGAPMPSAPPMTSMVQPNLGNSVTVPAPTPAMPMPQQPVGPPIPPAVYQGPLVPPMEPPPPLPAGAEYRPAFPQNSAQTELPGALPLPPPPVSAPALAPNQLGNYASDALSAAAPPEVAQRLGEGLAGKIGAVPEYDLDMPSKTLNLAGEIYDLQNPIDLARLEALQSSPMAKSQRKARTADALKSRRRAKARRVRKGMKKRGRKRKGSDKSEK